MKAPLAVPPPRNSPLGLRSLLANAGSLLELAASNRRIDASDFPYGDGRVVLVIPAFLAGDWLTTGLRRFLCALGYRAETAGVFVNLGPTRGLVEKLDNALECCWAKQGGPIDIIGQSLGGILARDLGLRFPERVRQVITLCSPIRMPITTPLAPAAAALGIFCDPDWLVRRDAIIGPLQVPVTALYSEEDGVVDWRECLQEGHSCGENVRVTGAHSTIGASPSALAAIAQALKTSPAMPLRQGARVRPAYEARGR